MFDKKSGFTLVELVTVVAIIAVLAAVAVPVFIGVTDRAKDGVAIADAAEISNAINYYNNLNPDNKLSQSDVSGWTSLEDMESSALGNLAPRLKPENFTEAIGRVQVDEHFVATASNSFN